MVWGGMTRFIGNGVRKGRFPRLALGSETYRLQFAGWIAMVLCLFAYRGKAIAPHEVALLYNPLSTNSVRIALEYAEMRGIPERNRIAVRVPERFLSPIAEMTDAAFTRRIWEPVNDILAERQLTDQILAWVYSVDFPLRVTGNPDVSLTGLTFLRNRRPDPDVVKDGRYGSPLYGGPDPFDGGIHPPAGFHYQRQHQDTALMPLPAAMLGYTGEGGNTPRIVLRTLRVGLAAEATRPRGTVYFVTAPGIRSEVRESQFAPAIRELGLYGVRGRVVSEFPAGANDVFGLLAGMADPRPETIGGFLPGAFAEHLTSFSAVYDVTEQTKMTAWTAAGASASAGAVTEPRAYWTKFPHARFFVYYAAGCSYLESFYQAVRCPLQTVPIGDPLMRPFAPSGTVVFDPVPEPGTGVVRARIDAPQPSMYHHYEFRIDDRLVKQGTGRIELNLDEIGLAPATYRLRLTVRRRDRIRHPLWAETEITIPKNEGGP